METDPWIRTNTGIWILSFSSTAFKIPTKNKLFYFLFTAGTFASVFKDNKSLRSYKTVEIKVILNFLLFDEMIQIRILRKRKLMGGILRIRIPNTDHTAMIWFGSPILLQ